MSTVRVYAKGAFFYSQFWNENGQNVKCARFSIPHSGEGKRRKEFAEWNVERRAEWHNYAK